MHPSPPTCVLVTGGAGYVGSHAALELLREGLHVIIVDTLERGSQDTIDRLKGQGNLTFVQGDCGSRAVLEPLLGEVDSIMHFAAYARIAESIEFPDRYHHNNVEVTRSLLEAAVEADVHRFILSSTCAVYGCPSQIALPVNEDCPLDPQSPYGVSKIEAENLVSQVGTLATGTLRFFNVIGVDASGILTEPVLKARLLSACLQTARGLQDQFTIYGTNYDTADGTAVRDFVHVTDIARAHVALMNNMKPGTHQTYNVGCGHGTSVMEVLRAVEKISGQTLSTIKAKRRPGDIPAIWADTTRIQESLDWCPQYKDIEAMVATSWQSD
ncbi:MAG: UDP-glucose 4-epimerase GalE [Planctomycetota bacterium]|nr:UDP-glucose 4-epimerase GalE [Planctomycetota bacterium]